MHLELNALALATEVHGEEKGFPFTSLTFIVDIISIEEGACNTFHPKMERVNEEAL